MFLDHINMDRADNRISNLRETDNAQNMHNRCAQSNNTSGFKGVSYDKARSLYAAEISYKGEKYHIGRFSTAIEAHEAYKRAATKLHGEFARFE